MPITSNGYYNDPALAQTFATLGQAFAPTSPTALAGYATANAKNQEAQRLAALFEYARNGADFNQTTFDRMGQAVGNWNPSQGYYGVDTTAATARRGQDVKAQTDLADARARANATMFGHLYGPVSEGQIRPGIDAASLSAFGGPSIDIGPVAGRAKPLTEEQVKGAILQGLNPDQKTSAVMGSVPVETIMRDGQPVIVPRNQAYGQQPIIDEKNVPKPTNYFTPDGKSGTAIMKPGVGLVDTQTGAQIPAGSRIANATVNAQSMDQIQGGKRMNDAKSELMNDDIGRALQIIQESPRTSTGAANQALGSIGGTNANALNKMLDTIRANVSFDNLQNMRATSPTGGALGNVSDADMKLLGAVLGDLSGSNRPQDLEYNLKRLYNLKQDIVHGKGNGPQRFDIGTNQPGAAPAAPAAPGSPAAAQAPNAPQLVIRNPQTGERMTLQNGQWVPLK